MLAHIRASAIARLDGPGNYKEWSHKVELHMRVHKMWPAVLSTPRPIETVMDLEDDNNIFVAARKRIYIQCADTFNRRVKLFLGNVIDPQIMPHDYLEWSIPHIWFELKRKFGNLKLRKKRKLKLQQNQKIFKFKLDIK
ncbi:uncharacterized protein LOC116806474 [Drosophila grimshawi]|uniref:uncharacterized protein LOC116806474 n=1 Tax=Drosophila grimshawi TaxID=7222 RepID=UPI000C87097C|nr:uncharacterized protein LOC116806474 [Drosophila grimshawi]